MDYGGVEYTYKYKLLCAMKVPYMFFAPSMGPFLREERNKLRRYILSHASAIALRDPISAKYVREFLPEKRVYQGILQKALKVYLKSFYPKMIVGCLYFSRCLWMIMMTPMQLNI